MRVYINREKKNGFFFIFLMIGILSLMVYFLILPKSDTTTVEKPEISTAEKVTSKSNTNTSSKNEKKLRNLLKYRNMFGNAINRPNIEDITTLTDEEIAERRERHEKLDSLGTKVYRREAHRILEEMLQNEPKDRVWSSELESFIQDNTNISRSIEKTVRKAAGLPVEIAEEEMSPEIADPVTE